MSVKMKKSQRPWDKNWAPAFAQWLALNLINFVKNFVSNFDLLWQLEALDCPIYK